MTSAEIQKWHREYADDRDALAAENAKLREALHRNVVRDGFCAECEDRPYLRRWAGNPENHAPGCLAAPKDSA